MLTGGNNYGRQAGGEVTTAYAPDTAIDNLLLRHEPRYTHYGSFFQTLTRYSATLLSNPVANTLSLACVAPLAAALPAPAKPPSLSVSHCSDDDPAHQGVLDPTQKWAHDGGSLYVTLGNVHWCLDASLGGNAASALAPCKSGSLGQQFTINATSGHVASVGTWPCTKPRRSGKCHQCLDLRNDGPSIDLCKLTRVTRS